MPNIKVEPIRRLVYRPPGYRVLGDPIAQTEKAVRFLYYDWILWLPKFSVVHLKDGRFCAPEWAITSSKDHKSARHGSSAEEYLYQQELKETKSKETKLKETKL